MKVLLMWAGPKSLFTFPFQGTLTAGFPSRVSQTKFGKQSSKVGGNVEQEEQKVVPSGCSPKGHRCKKAKICLEKVSILGCFHTGFFPPGRQAGRQALLEREILQVGPSGASSLKPDPRTASCHPAQQRHCQAPPAAPHLPAAPPRRASPPPVAQPMAPGLEGGSCCGGPGPPPSPAISAVRCLRAVRGREGASRAGPGEGATASSLPSPQPSTSRGPAASRGRLRGRWSPVAPSGAAAPSPSGSGSAPLSSPPPTCSRRGTSPGGRSGAAGSGGRGSSRWSSSGSPLGSPRPWRLPRRPLPGPSSRSPGGGRAFVLLVARKQPGGRPATGRGKKESKKDRRCGRPGPAERAGPLRGPRVSPSSRHTCGETPGERPLLPRARQAGETKLSRQQGRRPTEAFLAGTWRAGGNVSAPPPPTHTLFNGVLSVPGG